MCSATYRHSGLVYCNPRLVSDRGSIINVKSYSADWTLFWHAQTKSSGKTDKASDISGQWARNVTINIKGDNGLSWIIIPLSDSQSSLAGDVTAALEMSTLCQANTTLIFNYLLFYWNVYISIAGKVGGTSVLCIHRHNICLVLSVPAQSAGKYWQCQAGWEERRWPGISSWFLDVQVETIFTVACCFSHFFFGFIRFVLECQRVGCVLRIS